MRLRFWDKFISNNYCFNSDQPDYRRVYLNNIILLTLIFLLIFLIIINIFIFKLYAIAYMELIGLPIAGGILFYFHKTNHIKITALATVIIIMTVDIVYQYIIKSANYSLFWITPIPLVAFFLLGKRTGLLLTLLFYSIIFLFTYLNYANWAPFKFDRDSFVNILIAVVSIILLVSFFEFSRDEAHQKLIQANKALELQNKEIKQMNADKDLFISVFAHDLKSPFSSMLGFLNALSENIRNYDIDKIERQVKLVNSSAQNTLNLLDDILMWVTRNHGEIPFKPQKISLLDTLNAIAENLKLAARTKDITIYYNLDHEPKVYADVDMLNTVLRNLVSNAIKYSNYGGQIDISFETDPQKVTLTVADHGIGINQVNLKKLFENSQKISEKGTANEKGSGFGLLLCKEFVARHGGSIWAESEPGKGSRFRFMLPNQK